MPWADKERNRAAVRDWMRRNPDRVKAHRAKWVAKRKRLRVRIVRPLNKYTKLTREQRVYFQKLRRMKYPLREAQVLAYGPDWVQPNAKKPKTKAT